MIVSFKFDLTKEDQKYDYECMIRATQMRYVLSEMENLLRNYDKYESYKTIDREPADNITPEKVVSLIRREFLDLMSENIGPMGAQ